MNLIELYDSLKAPENDNKVFNAIQIPEYPNFRIAIDSNENAVLLLTVTQEFRSLNLKNLRLKYLQLEQNLECKVYESNSFKLQSFTVITFKSDDRSLKEYFLRIAATLVKAIGPNATQHKVIGSLKKFIEVFQTLNDTPTNTINGLWAELFLIEYSNNPKELTRGSLLKKVVQFTKKCYIVLVTKSLQQCTTNYKVTI